ncbi:unnamed protein product [Ostreobium quekettii]|uniref:Pentatricopeptide repeat-containing protein n=1 Tax=Ostreobium quekettii TaxID=121088 RepID=A0A8S1JEW6_9CHLO|nr:unnamed protein product [Ostreobium quekettii]
MPEITLGKVVKHIGDHSERMKSAEEVVKRAIRLGRESDLVLSKFFKSCGMQGRLEVMQSCFAHWLKEGNVTYGQKSISALITSSLRNNHPQCGKEIVRKLIDHGVPVGTIAFNSLIQEFSRAEMIEEALELFDWLQCSEEQHADKRTYQTVLWGMKRCKKLDALQMVYEAFLEEGWELDATLYFAFMTAAATAHDASFAEDMLLLFKKGKGELDCKVLNMYLQVLSQSACFPPNLEEVLEMYSASGKEPDAYTFTALLTGAYRSYQRMSVIDMLVKEISKSGMAITPVTSCAAILGYKNCTMDPPMERCERAQKVFDLTEDKNRACYHLLMSLYAENMDLATAIRLQSDMEAVGLPSNSRTYKTLEQACTEAGLMGYAEKYEKLWKQALKQDETESSAKLGKE